jgi:cupin 2 domain-containing protein
MRHPEVPSGNLFDQVSDALDAEEFRTLASSGSTRVLRIVSTGQATAPDQWLDQPEDEWVVVLKGRAAIRFDGEAAVRVLAPGDYLSIPAHVRHRVEWTAATEPTVWLAVHYT